MNAIAAGHRSYYFAIFLSLIAAVYFAATGVWWAASAMVSVAFVVVVVLFLYSAHSGVTRETLNRRCRDVARALPPDMWEHRERLLAFSGIQGEISVRQIATLSERLLFIEQSAERVGRHGTPEDRKIYGQTAVAVQLIEAQCGAKKGRPSH